MLTFLLVINLAKCFQKELILKKIMYKQEQIILDQILKFNMAMKFP